MIVNNQKLYTKFLTRLYDLPNPADEYQQQQLTKIGNNVGIFLLISNLFLVVSSCLINLITNSYEVAFEYLIIAICVIMFISVAYLSYAAHHYKLTIIEVEKKIFTK